MVSYYFQIVIDGYSDSKESVEILYHNLEGEIYHEDSNVYPPRYVEILSKEEIAAWKQKLMEDAKHEINT